MGEIKLGPEYPTSARGFRWGQYVKISEGARDKYGPAYISKIGKMSSIIHVDKDSPYKVQIEVDSEKFDIDDQYLESAE